MWYVVYMGCAESAEEVRGVWMSLILILVLLCTMSVIGWILSWVWRIYSLDFGGVWDFGYPHLYTLYPFRIAVNTS